jgi:hypothetical protein
VKADKLSMYSRPIIASLLVSSGLLQLAAPVLANGTAAGTQITNTATASYEDPTDPTKPLNTFSNTVKVTVAEVAGLTLTADTFSVVDGTTLVPTNAGAVPGNKVYFDYTITNVGNDPTQIRVPGTAKVTGSGQVEQVQYWNGTAWVNIPNAGEFISGSKAPGETLKVRVITLVLSGAVPGDDLIVTLGNTLTPNAQNVLRDSTGGDVYTVDNADSSVIGEVNGAPENGVREAAATQKIVIGATPEAFVTVTKVRGAQNPGANAAILSDDTFTYDLGLKVANQADLPVGSTKSAADLEDTTVPGIGSGILVSDAVPANTTAKSLTVPAGWVAVYTVSPTTIAANAATWVEIPGGPGVVTVPTPPSGTISRVGFVKKRPTGSTTPISIAKGSTVSGMAVTVELTGFTAAGGTVANIAQVFGSTNVNGTPKLVFDESGDQNPNNYTSGNTPGPVDVAGNPVITSGVASPTDPDTDALNNNSGSGPGGEPNVFNVLPIAQTGILNGTGGKPGAVGPTGTTNDDFTNVSTPIPATTWSLNPTTGVYTANPIDPASVGFANTFQTAAGSPTQSVNLMPTTPTTALPAGTKVTITFGATSKTFVTDPTGLIFYNDGTTTPATPLVVPNVVAGTPVNYGTEIDLPSGTAQLKGYGVPIVAFVDNGTGPAGLDPTDTQNITIDRVYTGYLKLNKEVQISEADGTVIEAFTSTPSATITARPGQLLQYRITYANISDIAPANSGSVALSAQNIKITEDGNTAPNNWAKIDPVTNAPITGHQTGSASDSNNGVITFDNGASANSSANVGVYKDVVAGPLAPQQVGTFSFSRIVK